MHQDFLISSIKISGDSLLNLSNTFMQVNYNEQMKTPTQLSWSFLYKGYEKDIFCVLQ